MRLGDLAARLGDCEVEGDADFPVAGVASLEEGGHGDLGFVRSARFAGDLARSKIGAVIAPPGVDGGGRPVIRSTRPSLDFARAVALLVPAPFVEPGVHPSAVVAADARLAAGVAVGAQSVVGAGCQIGEGSLLHPRVTLYPDVRVGAGCVLHAGVVLREGTRIGDRVLIQPGVVIGGDGFGFELDEDGRWVKVPQVGHVEIGDDVEIGAGSTIDRARLGSTRIARGVKIDNLVQIGHNCELGEDSIVAAQCGLAGGAVLGRRVILMGQAGVNGRARLGDGSFVAARSAAVADLEPGARVFGYPALPERRWHRAIAIFGKLPELLRRVRALERRLPESDPQSRPDPDR